MQEQHTFAATTGELVDEEACATEEDIRCALHEREVIIKIAGCDQELVLTYLNHLAYGVARKGDVASPLISVPPDASTAECDARSRRIADYQA
jgi:hypothetical protein